MDRFSAAFIFFALFSSLIVAQQPYEGVGTTACYADTSDGLLGYTCNGARRSCQAYLTFRAVQPYTSVASVSSILGANLSQVAAINAVSENAVFSPGYMVLVPVTCSCSGQLYQSNTSYVVRGGDTYLAIANNTYQGLSNCQTLMAQNPIPANNLNIGDNITVPLRCACPTSGQIGAGVNFLVCYLVAQNQDVPGIGGLFGVPPSAILAANQLSANPIINPFTTLLIPLRNPPTANQLNVPQLPPPPPAGGGLPTPPPPVTASRSWIYIVVGVVVGVAALAAGVTVCCLCFKKRKTKDQSEPAISSQSFESAAKKPFKEGEDFDQSYSRDFLDNLSSIAKSLKVYPFEELKAATQNFSPSCLINGSVYRGVFNGDLAAIKKMNGDVSKEINLLNKINHFNMIRLSGVSFNEGHWYLVYEYASNGALVDWIQSMDPEKKLDWNQRLQIALDIATGLSYLHSFTSPPHVHKDLNSSNVLLDHNFRAKIANFGLARSIEGEGEFALTRHIVGTQGYMAPEYLETGIVSPQMDVYAYGVLLLEILSGKGVSQLLEKGIKLMQNASAPENESLETLKNLMDPSLQDKYPKEIALVLLRIAKGCLQREPSDRPDMDDVSQTIARISASTVSGEWAISISENQAPPA